MITKTKKRPTQSRHEPDFKAALRALKRAAKRAKETARRSKTSVAFWQDGRVKTVRPGAKTQKSGRS